MLDKFDMPIRISAIDYVGTYNENAAIYRGRALSELKILYSQMQFQSLTQCKRTVNIADNVIIECHISFGAAFATMTVGAGGKHVGREKECFCSTFGIAAGRIVTLKDEIQEYGSIVSCYPEDGSYRADVHICQQAAQGNPRLIEIADVYESAGKSSRSGTRSQNIDFSVNSVILNVPFQNVKQIYYTVTAARISAGSSDTILRIDITAGPEPHIPRALTRTYILVKLI